MGRGVWRPRAGDCHLEPVAPHATTINIKGESYRLREKKRAGLLTRAHVKSEDNKKGDQPEIELNFETRHTSITRDFLARSLADKSRAPLIIHILKYDDQ